jgi:hypothetical protein
MPESHAIGTMGANSTGGLYLSRGTLNPSRANLALRSARAVRGSYLSSDRLIPLPLTFARYRDADGLVFSDYARGNPNP